MIKLCLPHFYCCGTYRVCLLLGLKALKINWFCSFILVSQFWLLYTWTTSISHVCLLNIIQEFNFGCLVGPVWVRSVVVYCVSIGDGWGGKEEGRGRRRNRRAGGSGRHRHACNDGWWRIDSWLLARSHVASSSICLKAKDILYKCYKLDSWF